MILFTGGAGYIGTYLAKQLFGYKAGDIRLRQPHVEHLRAVTCNGLSEKLLVL
jgi:nucleoside-diphosphate-sugar epimerase